MAPLSICPGTYVPPSTDPVPSPYPRQGLGQHRPTVFSVSGTQEMLNKCLWTRKVGQVGGESWDVSVGTQPGRKAGAWTPRVGTIPPGVK